MSDRKIMDGKSIKEVLLETALDAGFDKVTMREFKTLVGMDLIADDYTPHKIKEIRAKTHMSQAVFAHALNVRPTSVQKWEIGESKPAGAAIKLLSIIEDKGIEAII